MKRFALGILACTLISANTLNVFAITDKDIFTDAVYNVYEGTEGAKPTITNLKFTDVANNFWAKEAITKAGALDIVKGYDRKYRPNSYVTNQEALAFVLRVAGLEDEAQIEGEKLKNQSLAQSPLPIWTLGYLTLARDNGLITPQQYQDAINPNQDTLPKDAFFREARVTREQAASWVIKALNIIRQEPLTSDNQQSIYNYSDWQSTDVSLVNDMEIALDNGIIKGDKKNRLNPKGALTRAEMAQILSNMDSLYNEAVGLTKKVGTVSGIKDNQVTQTGSASLERSLYIRTADGTVDVIKYMMESNSSPQSLNKDAVVYNSGAVTGLSSIKEGSQIEYLVDDLTKTVKFVSVKNNKVNTTEVNGKLNKIDFTNGIIQLKDNTGKTFDYYLADGLMETNEQGNFLFLQEQKRKEQELPMGSMLKLELTNNIVTKVSYVGDSNLSKELRGVVLENNAEYGYIIVYDENGKQVTKNYYPDDVEVEKQPYYQNGDDIGYIDQMFPNFKYDPRDTTIDQIEAGDVVFITSSKDDPQYIEKISASPNYTMKRGKVMQIENETDIFRILVQFDNGQTAWYDMPTGVYISRGGKPITPLEITNGDYVKLLVNEAIVSPGEVIEAVKEVVVEESGHLIGDLLKGQIGSFDPIQKNVSLQNSYTLDKEGWGDYKQIRKLKTSNKNIEYYFNGQKVSQDFVKTKLKRADGEAYVALENSYSGDTISKITFRTGRDEALEPDVVATVDGAGNFTLASGTNVLTDDGTIVRKNGKLVNANSISVNDYARVSLNGDGKAGIVDIYDSPKSSVVSIARGRIKEVEDKKWFVVQSMSQLNGDNWEYSPIERKFTIDDNTLYITEEGIKNINEFIGYTQNTVIDKAFTIVFDGDRATHIIDAPFATKLVTGRVYDAQGETVNIKDAKYMKPDKTWDTVSLKDATLKITGKPNTIVIKGNKVTNMSSIKKGDKLKVLTEKLPEKVTSGTDVSARIIFIEN